MREKEAEEGSPWQLPEGGKPLSDSQLWRYIARADAMAAESCRASRKKLMRRHLAQRRHLYAKATLSGDYRTALAILRDEAELLNLYDFRLAELEKRILELEKAKQHDHEAAAAKNGTARRTAR
ncbi:MAG TPA: hypothetical protein VH643_21175 [Gemmataceae bacterium]